MTLSRIQLARPMTYHVEIFVRREWVSAPVFFTSKADAEDYCDKRGDKLTRVVKVDAPSPAPVASELRAIDCDTPKKWARWMRERVEYEDPYGYERSRY